MQPMSPITDPRSKPTERPKPVGLILDARDMDYSSMTKVGRITIEFDDDAARLLICTDGFEFSDLSTCRTHAVRAMAWARDVLAAQVENEKNVFGEVRVAIG